MAVVRRANLPGPPEKSLPVRVAVWGALAVSIGAAYEMRELSGSLAALFACGVTTGMTFSYWRIRPPAERRGPEWQYPGCGSGARSSGPLKVVLAAGSGGAFIWFFHLLNAQSAAPTAAGIESSLAELFALMQLLHSFDVPARRDLMFSLAGSATLMAVAGTQATSSDFGVFVFAWVLLSSYSLVSGWHSAAGVRPRVLGIPQALLAMAMASVIAVTGVAVLPAAEASRVLGLPSSLAADLKVAIPGSIAGAGAHGTLPVSAGRPGSPVGVGGYLGFAGQLDLAVRGRLSSETVMRVRAQEPGFFLGETFDQWNGTTWSNSARSTRQINGGPEFTVPQATVPGLKVAVGSVAPADVQTFYVVRTLPSLVFGEENRVQVWLSGTSLYLGPGRSIRSGWTMGPGTIYTVVSRLDRATGSQLASAGRLAAGSTTYPAAVMGALDASSGSRYTGLPGPGGRYARVAHLARLIVKGQSSVYGEARALEGWMGSHLRYSTAIPPLPAGADAVNNFLFSSRVGYCEQISTSLAVMLRTLGVPAREAVGYVPGPYNPITDLYDIQARDAHAWVQVWFPGVGWQSFDPTAHVPLANPSPGSVMISAVGHWVSLGAMRVWGTVRSPYGWPPLLAVLAGAAVVIEGRRKRAVLSRLLSAFEKRGARTGIRRRRDETLREYSNRLAPYMSSDDLRRICDLMELAAYGGRPLTGAEVAELRRLSRTPSSVCPEDGAGRDRERSEARRMAVRR